MDNLKPYPFQQEGIEFLLKANGNAILADEMGLGKTIQCIGYASTMSTARPVLVVCPASLKLNWKAEIRKWTSERAYVINGQYVSMDSIDFLENFDWLIINYDILSFWAQTIQKLGPKIMIADEAHYLKNEKSKRTKVATKLARSIPHKIMVTGTPILNGPIEMWQLLNIVKQEHWRNRWWYAQKYCDPKQKQIWVRGKARKVWDLSGASNLEELHQKIQPYMIRRYKSDVLTDMPDKTRSIIPINIDQVGYQHFYNQTRDELEAENNPAKAAVIIERLKQWIALQKMAEAKSWITNFIDQEKLVIFATHREITRSLYNSFNDRAVIITGETSSKDRDAAVSRFQNDDDTKLFVGNMQAAGVGITLTAASNVAFLELGWTPSEHLQAEDRCHRIGQHYPVNIWYLLADHTIDNWIFSKLDRKRKVIEQVLAGELSTAGFNKQDMATELRQMFQKTLIIGAK